MHYYTSENTLYTATQLYTHFRSGKIPHSDSPPDYVPFSTTILKAKAPLLHG